MLSDKERATRLLRRVGIEQSAMILNAFFSGSGLRSFRREVGYSVATTYRLISVLTNFVYEQIDVNFSRGKLRGTKLNLHFGRNWEADSKVIPVSPNFCEGIYRWTRKNGRNVAKLMISDILDKETHFCLSSQPVGTGSVNEYKVAFLKARQRAGFAPFSVSMDGEQAEPVAATKALGSYTRPVILKKMGEKSQLHLAEGYHKLMDRKLESGIHSKDDTFMIKGIWLQYNFVEGKDQLCGLTPFQRACRLVVDWNGEGWMWLLKYSVETYKKSIEKPFARATPLSTMLP